MARLYATNHKLAPFYVRFELDVELIKLFMF